MKNTCVLKLDGTNKDILILQLNYSSEDYFALTLIDYRTEYATSIPIRGSKAEIIKIAKFLNKNLKPTKKKRVKK